MQRKLSLCALICFFYLPISAQQLTPYFGVSVTTVTDVDNIEGSSRPKATTGFVIGLSFFQGKKDKQVYFYPEIQFIQKGYLIRETGNSFAYDIKENFDFRINYLVIPLNFRIYPTKKNHNFYMTTGFYEAIALGGKYSYFFRENDHGTISTVSKSKSTLDFSIKIKGYNDEDYSITNKNDIGFQFGIGIRLFKEKGLLDFRYAVGLSALANEDPSKPKNRAIMVTLGFPIKTK